MIGELTYMRQELLANDAVNEVKGIDNDMIVKFNISNSWGGPTATEILSIIGRYDCNLYESSDSNYQYVAKFESDG